jgi:hypothetical protein
LHLAAGGEGKTGTSTHHQVKSANFSLAWIVVVGGGGGGVAVVVVVSPEG